jgi:hypothetical protein
MDKGDALIGLGLSSNMFVGDRVGANVDKLTGTATGAIGAGAGKVATFSAVTVPKISAKYKIFPLEEILKKIINRRKFGERKIICDLPEFGFNTISTFDNPTPVEATI